MTRAGVCVCKFRCPSRYTKIIWEREMIKTRPSCFLLFLLCHAASGPWSLVTSAEVDFAYHNFQEMTALLNDMHTQHSDLTKLYSIGKSVQGRELWVMLVTSEPHSNPILKPNVKYVANMHGNEAVGRELMLHLIAYLVNNYQTDSYVQWLLDNTKVHIMPSMNPDGFENSIEGVCSGTEGRGNANNYDLNRNFPDYFSSNADVQQPETLAVREWIKNTQFVLSGNIHGGALVASYPFDNLPPTSPTSYRARGTPSLTPDDDVFHYLAGAYSFSHNNMYLATTCRDGTPPFTNGTTNGAAWYPLKGGMQDYNYIWAGCMEITLEISCCKYPSRHDLPTYWADNKKALLDFLGKSHQGIWGQVMDPDGNPIYNATLRIRGRKFGFRTTPHGEFWRILRPGTYTLEAFANGYEPANVNVRVRNGVTIQNLTLYPHTSGHYEPQGDSVAPRDVRTNYEYSDFNSASIARWPGFVVMGSHVFLTSLAICVFAFPNLKLHVFGL